MIKNALLLGLVSLISIAAIMTSDQCNSPQCHRRPQTVPYVDLARYQGKWYQQARIPVFYEWGCTNVTATYTQNKDGTIKVDNYCIRDGKESGGSTEAFASDASHAKLRVQWIPGFKWLSGGYWIVKLGDANDYGYSVVSSPDYKNLWILSRQPQLDENTYNQIINWLTVQGGYKVGKLIRNQA